MSFSHVVTQNVQTGGVSVTSSNTYTSSGRISVEEAIPDSSTDLEITVSIDVSAVKSIYILATGGDMTLETNNGSTPDDTISLVDGVPYLWTTDSYDTLQLGTDVTSIFMTNSSGATSTVKLEAIVDTTP